MINRAVEEFQKILKADSILLGDLNTSTAEKRVNLHYYLQNTQSKNVGDYLSLIIVNWMLKREGLSLSDTTSEKKHLYAIGSILQMGYQNATVWGSGFAFSPSILRSFFHSRITRSLDIRCIRGPLSRQVCLRLGHSCPEVYGDPSILLPFIYPHMGEDKTLDYLIIPHRSMYKKYLRLFPEKNVLNMATNDYENVVNTICSARRVISSSLHGIILSEVYGVPTDFLFDREKRLQFKYDDYYLSTGRNVKPYDDVRMALDCIPSQLPDLTLQQKNVLESFPYDLWR